MIVMAPADENECRQMLYTGFHASTARRRCAIRAAAAPGVAVAAGADGAADRQGRGAPRAAQRHRASSPSARMLHAGADGRPSGSTRRVVNMRFVKPLDVALLLRARRARIARSSRSKRTPSPGGAGSAVAEVLAAHGARAAACCTSACPTGSSSTARRERVPGRRRDSTAASASSAVERWWQPLAGRLSSGPAATRAVAWLARGRPDAQSSQGGPSRHPSRLTVEPQRAPCPIEDVQGRADTRRIADRPVGIKDINHPVRVKDRSGGEQHTIANFNMYVNLPHNFKGIGTATPITVVLGPVLLLILLFLLRCPRVCMK